MALGFTQPLDFLSITISRHVGMYIAGIGRDTYAFSQKVWDDLRSSFSGDNNQWGSLILKEPEFT
jgi:hypothetical protein